MRSVIPECYAECTRRHNRRVTLQLACSELDSALEGDHARGAVTTEADAEQAGRGRDRASERAKTRWNGIAGHACFNLARQSKIRMVEGVEHLAVQAECYGFVDGDCFRDIEVGVRVMRATNQVATRVAELTIRGGIASRARSSGRIDD